jgi:hypothetical protein
MFSCDYNGWADVPEEEREGIDAFEATQPESPTTVLVWMPEASLDLLPEEHERLAA